MKNEMEHSSTGTDLFGVELCPVLGRMLQYWDCSFDEMWWCSTCLKALVTCGTCWGLLELLLPSATRHQRFQFTLVINHMYMCGQANFFPSIYFSLMLTCYSVSATSEFCRISVLCNIVPWCKLCNNVSFTFGPPVLANCCLYWYFCLA